LSLSFHQQRLANGLTVLADPDPAAHTAAVGFFVQTGARDEPRELMGVSHFLEHMMFKGTARRSAEDVNREFDEMGADYNAFTGHECTVYYAHVLPEFLPRAVDLIGDMLRPALREEDFSVEKKVILEEIGMYEDRPQWRLQDYLLECHFGGHPLGFRVLGTTASIGALGVESMRKYFQQRYDSGNIIVAASGRFDPQGLYRDLEGCKALDGGAAAGRSYELPAPHGVERSLADPRLTRHYMAAMSPAPSAQDPRRYIAAVLADALGGGDGSRLHWSLIDPALADEADFAHVPQDRVGAFMAYASCDPERAGQVEQIMLETLDAAAAGLDAGEVERAKNKLATQATLKGEQPLGRMMNLGGQWTYLRDYVPLEQELERLMAVTLDQVRGLLTEMPLVPRTIVRLGPR
jgi:predicted Zn-dependent peptidase